MTEEQEEKMIKAAHKYWSDESGRYDKEDIMVDAFVEGYRQAFALYNVVGRSEQFSLADMKEAYNAGENNAGSYTYPSFEEWLSKR